MNKKNNILFLKKKVKNKNYIKKKLNNLNLINISLSYIDFWESLMQNCNFENSNISNCIFTDTDLSNSQFNNSIIKDTNFTHSILKGVNFSSSKLIRINLRDAIFDEHTIWPKKFDPLKYGAVREKNFNPFDYKAKLSLNTINNFKTTMSAKKNLENVYKKNKLSILEKKIIKELTVGKGYIVIKNLYSKKNINLAEKIISNKLKKDNRYKFAKKKFEVDKKYKSINFFDIQNYHKIFVDFMCPKPVMKAFEFLMGEDFICTYYACQNLMSGGRGQNLHLDYPYVTFKKPGDKIPIGMGSNKFLLSCGILTYLNEFDKDYVGPLILEKSHKLRKFPDISDVKKNKFIKIKVPKGGILVLNTLVWHAGLPNYSKNKDRNLILGHYTPSFVKRRLDIKKLTKKIVLDKDKKNNGILEKLIN